MRPRISIALSTFNGGAHLDDQLESLARQTLPPHELVVGDDGSADGTLDVLRAFADRVPFPVRVHANATRLGFADNFLQTAGRCEGEAIAFCDQDDVWREDKLRVCADALADPAVGLVVHAARVVDVALRPTGALQPAIERSRRVPPHTLSDHDQPSGFAMVFRRSLLAWPLVASRQRSRYWAGPMYHDEWVWLWARLCSHIALVAEPLALYRQHEANCFGVEKGPGPLGLRRTADLTLGADASTYVETSRLAESYARYLRSACYALPRWREDLEQGASAYEAVAAHALGRAALYDPGAPAHARVGRLLRLLRHGGYRSRARGGLGVRSLLKDSTLALVRPGDPAAS